MLARRRPSPITVPPSGARSFVHPHHRLLVALVGAALILVPDLVMGQVYDGYGSYGSTGGGIIYYGNGAVVTNPPADTYPDASPPSDDGTYSTGPVYNTLPPCPTVGTVFPNQPYPCTPPVDEDPYGYPYGAYPQGYPYDNGYPYDGSYPYYGGPVVTVPNRPYYNNGYGHGGNGSGYRPSPSGPVNGRPGGTPGNSGHPGGSTAQPPKAPNGRPMGGNRVSVPSSARSSSNQGTNER